MRIDEFKLEHFFERHEFSARYLLSSSDAETLGLAELVALADDEMRARWNDLRLGYTELSAETRTGIPRARPTKEETMSKEELERLDDQGVAAWDGHDAEAFVNLFAEQFVANDVALPEPITMKDGLRQYAQSWFTAFPDMSVKLVNRVVGDDSVAAELQFTGTNTGPMMMGGREIPPTGKSVVGKGMYFVRVKGGKVVEFNSYPDIAGMMMQLGFMPQM